MSRKLIIDGDPGIDTAVALCLALFDPRLEVVAVTAAAGNVPAEQASRNVQAIIEQLDPPRFPRIGSAVPSEDTVAIDARHMHGEDGLGNAGFVVSELHHQHPSDKIICDEVRAAPDEVTILTLGPLTNIARAFQRDPAVASMVNRIIMMGGSVEGIGNATAVAEFNMYYDPGSARSVFRSATTKTLIPLDVTRQVNLTLDFMERLPSESTRVGGFLRRILPFFYRAYHQMLGQESIHLHDAVALLAVLDPDLMETRELAGDVETRGELTTGATIFDRRPNCQWRRNMEVGCSIKVERVIAAMIEGLARASRRA